MKYYYIVHIAYVAYIVHFANIVPFTKLFQNRVHP